jgi:ADP-heptose:LPS heptosyltransferase
MPPAACHPGLVPDIHKVAILRANAIGDFFFTLPALEALRAAYPDAELVLLGKPWHRDFLAGRPGPIDRVEVVPPAPGVGEPEDACVDLGELDAFFDRMAGERFDLAVQCHGGGRHSNPFVRRLGARLAVGLKSPEAIPLDRWRPYVYWQNEVLRWLEVVHLAGATPVTIVPRLAVTEADLAESRRVVPDGDQPLVALNPGAGDPERRWPPAGFAAVGTSLIVKGVRVLITGATWDRPLADEIQRSMDGGAEDTTGRLTLGGLAGLLSRCAVVISNDSGPLHLANAAGAASVGIYWCFNAITAGPVETARHRPIISWRVTCPICGIDRAGRRCDHHPSFVSDVPAEQVLAAADELLQAETSEIPSNSPSSLAARR